MKPHEFVAMLEKNNLSINEQQLNQLAVYFEMLVHENNLYNLTAITDLEGVYEKHFYDSISPLFIASFQNATLVDVGAGAGFPSLPLKIMDPTIDLYLLDSTAKKMNFIEKLKQELGLKKVTTIVARAEEFNDFQFDVVVARGVAPLNILLELVCGLVKKDGLVVAYKGSHYREELQASEAAIKVLGYQLMEQQEYQLPTDQSLHCNLYFKKVRTNDKIYPRSYSKIKAKPL